MSCLLAVVTRLDVASPWLLLLAPFGVLVVWWTRGRARTTVGFSDVRIARELPSGWRARIAWLPAAALALGCVLAAVALARPRLGDERTVVQTEGVAIELVIDTSSSMLAHDFTGPDGEPTDRLSAVKSVVREFVNGGDGLAGRPHDLVGLTVFAGYAEATCPLTLDHDLLLESLDAAEIAQTRLEDGTSIGLGLAIAVERLRRSEVSSRVVVLLTDGENRDDENPPLLAAEAARKEGVRVYTIGMGTQGLAPYPQDLGDGRRVFNRIPVRIDEELLNRIADATGGVYQRATDTGALRRIYAEIDRLERVELEGVTYRSYRELFAWPLGAAALVWLFALVADATFLRRLGA